MKALRVRSRIRQELERALTRFDLILLPAAPSVAPRLGESLSDPLQMYLSDVYTVTANLAGLPCASFPCGEEEKTGLPVGAQLLARRDEEGLLLRAADAPALEEDGGRYRNYPAFPFDEERGFETYRIVIQPGGSLEAQPHLPGAEEYVTVFAGEAEIGLPEETYWLGTGDSLRFPADQPHRYANAGDEPVQLSMLIYYDPV